MRLLLLLYNGYVITLHQYIAICLCKYLNIAFTYYGHYEAK